MLFIVFFILFLFGLIIVGLVTLVSDSRENNSTSSSKLSWSQKHEFEDLNKPFKCSCGITSRRYQFKGDNHTICPQCNKELQMRFLLYHNYMDQIDDDREFPFAPKLAVSKFIELWNKKEDMKRIKKEIEDLKKNDEEIAAWEKLRQKELNKITKK